MRGRLTSALRVLLHVDDTPHRIALAFGLGVWIAFFPIVGIHTLMALGIAFALRMSRAAILMGAFINNPWTIGPLYAAGTFLGCFLLGVSPQGLSAIDWSGGKGGASALWAALRPFIWPFVVGNLVLGLAAGTSGYFLLLRALQKRRREAGGPAPGSGPF